MSLYKRNKTVLFPGFWSTNQNHRNTDCSLDPRDSDSVVGSRFLKILGDAYVKSPEATCRDPFHYSLNMCYNITMK